MSPIVALPDIPSSLPPALRRVLHDLALLCIEFDETGALREGWLRPLVEEVLADALTVPDAPRYLAQAEAQMRTWDLRLVVRGAYRHLTAHPDLPAHVRAVLGAPDSAHRGVGLAAVALAAELPAVAPTAAEALCRLARDARAQGLRRHALFALGAALPHLAAADAAAAFPTLLAFERDDAGFEDAMQTRRLLAACPAAWREPHLHEQLPGWCCQAPEVAIAAMPCLTAFPEVARTVLAQYPIEPPSFAHRNVLEAAVAHGVVGYDPMAVLPLAMSPDPALRDLALRVAAAAVQGDAPPAPAPPVAWRRGP